LTRPLDKHLDNDELDALVSSHAASVTDSGRLSEQALGEAQYHVESCQDCIRKVQMHKSVQSEIVGIGVPSNVPASPDCISDVEWLNVAAGLLPEVKTRELMKHAAQCGHCGPLLKSAAETLADEATPSEERLLASLNSVQTEWQKSMAATLRENAQERQQKAASWWRKMFAWPSLAYGFAGIAAVVLVAWFGLRTLRPPSAEQLLAQAYTEHRTLEVRIAGAKYAPVRVERSANKSNFDKSPSLLKAEALIGENLGKNPNDPTWLQSRARADLLDGNYESAIKSLQHALETEPDSPGLLTDLGSAYFLRAESANRPIDYGNAIESLGKALAKSPEDPIALFNRALACERMFLYAQAVDDWEHYLRVDPQGEWAEDARKRLAELKQKQEQHQKSLAEPLLRPAEIAKARANDAAVNAKINERIEEYLHLAVTDWLPNAYPAQSSVQTATEIQAALGVLAKMAETFHGDSWLAGLLSNTRGRNFPSAILLLASAVRSKDTGDYSEQLNSARRASQLFRLEGNLAGELRSEAEEIYAEHLLYEGRPCMSLIRSRSAQLELTGYAWLQSEVSLEESNCAGLLGDLGTTRAAVAKGVSLAKNHNYRTLYLRGLGFEADAEASLGDATKDFSLATEGLRIFWSTPVEVMEGYNFYTDLDTAADNLRLPRLQVALWRQATALIDSHPDLLQRAMAHRWYGNSAYLADMSPLAAEEFAKASALFAVAPKTPATTRDHMDAEIWLARIEARQGDMTRASARLQRMQPVLDGVPSFAPEIGFYSTQAEINMRRGGFSGTDSSLRSAIFLAEWALNSFSSEDERRQWAEQTQDAYRDLVAWKFREGDVSSALEFWEWYKGAELRSVQSVHHPLRGLEISSPPDAHDAPPLPEPTVVAVQMSSLREETIITYAAFPEGIAVWSYDDRGIFSQWVARPLPEVMDLTARFHALCSDPSSDLSVLRTTARSLYDLLVAPVEEHIGGGRVLVFEPDEMLASIPFEALLDRTDHYLAERSTVVISPGLYQAMNLRPSIRMTPESAALVVSVPSPGEEGWTPLADAEGEAQAVAGSFRSARWLKGPDAFLSAIQQNLRGAVVFHYAGHAVTSPERNGLVLAERDPRTHLSRLLTAQNLRRGDDAKLQLAVLSACQTGSRPDAADSGNEGLANAFLHSKVPHVITSRWNIDSSETAVLMKQFYALLLSGEDVAHSLHAAELGLASQPASAHPYYWAVFELQGVR
jgi:CHAT domain-containing protein/tetratricopeptide (TPR) repeat protein